MNLKKFISSVSALTIAASAFAGMAVTASAAESNDTVSFAAQSRITNNNDGTFTTAGNAGNGYALALADLSGVEGMSENVSKVEASFTMNVNNIGRLIIALGDKSVRGTTANGSSGSTYSYDGTITTFGKYANEVNFRVGGSGSGNRRDDFMNADLTVNVTFNKGDTNSYSLSITDGTNTLSASGNTSIEDFSVIEAYTWVSNATFAISDVAVKVTYTPAPKADDLSTVAGDGSITWDFGANKWLNEVASADNTYDIGNGMVVFNGTWGKSNEGLNFIGTSNSVNFATYTATADGKVVTTQNNSKSRTYYVEAGKTYTIQTNSGNARIRSIKFTPNGTYSTVGEKAVYTVADGYDADVAVGIINLDIVGTYNVANATYEGATGTIDTGITTEFTNAAVQIAVVINGATTTDAVDSVVFE